jgi:hypothetical protein
MRAILVKSYKDGSAFQRDANRQGARGYEIIEVNGQKQRVAIGRTAMNTLFTGGMGLLIGGRAHKGARVMVTYQYAGKEFAGSRRGAYLRSQLPALILILGTLIALAIYILH